MAVTPGSNKKSKKKGGTPQGKGGSTPQGAVSIKTPQSQKGGNVTPKFKKHQSQTPGANKSAGITTPQFQKASDVTPKSEKGRTKTPRSQKSSDVTPKFSKGKGQTPQSEKSSGMTPKSEELQAATPKMKKEQMTTPQSQPDQKPQVYKTPSPQKPVTPNSGAVVTMSAGHKSPKNKQQKATTPNQPKPVTPVAQHQSSNKKRKLDDDDDDESSSYDSAEEDFEALIGHPKKAKIEDTGTSPKKTPTALSPSKQPAGKQQQQLTPTSSKTAMIAKQSEEKLAAGTKRSWESDSDDENDDEDDDDDDEDEDDEEDDDEDDDDEDDDNEDNAPPFKKQKPVSEVVTKKAKIEQGGKEQKTETSANVARMTSSATLTEADRARDLKRQDALDRRMLFVKNIPKSATEAQVKALHGGIVNVQLRSMKWCHKARQQQLFAHIEFKDEASADEAHKALTGMTFGDRVLAVDYFGTKSVQDLSRKPLTADQLDPCKLFISRYPLETTSEELQALFPTATSAEVLRKQQGKPIGFAFVHFKDAEACRKAHDTADGLKIGGRTIMVVYARKKTDQQQPSSKQSQPAKEKASPVEKPTEVPATKPSAGKAAQPANVAVVKGQQQKMDSVKTSQPVTAKLGAGDLGDDSEDDDDDDDDDESNDLDDSLEEDDDDSEDGDDDDDDDSLDDDDDDDDD